MQSEVTKIDCELSPHSTFVLAWLTEASTIVSHAGDSRFFLFDSNNYRWQAKDHSMAQLLLDQGEITQDEVNNHPDQTRLYKSLGGNHASKPSFSKLPAIQPNQAMILCSDGFWSQVEFHELLPALSKNNLHQLLHSLVMNAAKSGGNASDNISVQGIVRI